jgi:iron-sulfur cluster repair protein YtfE (RIC family)
VKPSEVRERTLRDHEALRIALDRLERCCREAARGDLLPAGQLREAAHALIVDVERHMRWEERHLEPALREADAWGNERADRLRSDHREQREALGHVLAGLRDPGRPPALVARMLLDLIALLRDDMAEEEDLLLDPRVLRDDVVGIDVETG